jgi:hypothetical protein
MIITPKGVALPSVGWGFDCLGSSVQHLLNTKPTAIWPYVTGSGGIAWTPEEIDIFRRRGTEVILVNQGYGQGPSSALDGDEFDYEAGAWTVPGLLQVVAARRRVSWSTRIYCTWTAYGVVKQALAEAGTGGSVFFRIADWNIDQHVADLELHADVYAGQWASPTTNPATLVPGTSLTLAEAAADLSVLLHTSTGWIG